MCEAEPATLYTPPNQHFSLFLLRILACWRRGQVFRCSPAGRQQGHAGKQQTCAHVCTRRSLRPPPPPAPPPLPASSFQSVTQSSGIYSKQSGGFLGWKCTSWMPLCSSLSAISSPPNSGHRSTFPGRCQSSSSGTSSRSTCTAVGSTAALAAPGYKQIQNPIQQHLHNGVTTAAAAVAVADPLVACEVAGETGSCCHDRPHQASTTCHRV